MGALCKVQRSTTSLHSRASDECGTEHTTIRHKNSAAIIDRNKGFVPDASPSIFIQPPRSLKVLEA
jgi:hypothetical protein